MRFIAILITLIIPPILSGTHPGTDRSSSKLGACAKRILGEVDGVHKQGLNHEMEKDAQRVLWDFKLVLSSEIPRYQNRLSKFCKRGAAGTILRQFGERGLYELISTDVAGAKGPDDPSAALSMALIDIADVLSLSADGFACHDFWSRKTWMVPHLETDGLIPRVVLVYGRSFFLVGHGPIQTWR
jgi:hypothetical protein